MQLLELFELLKLKVQFTQIINNELVPVYFSDVTPLLTLCICVC